MSAVVNQALDELSVVGTETVSEGADSNDFHALAFNGWAGSALSTEGYNCWVMYVDRNGRPLSDFHLGIVRHSANETNDAPLPATRSIEAGERIEGGQTIRVFTAFSPILVEGDTVLGGVWVEVSADRQALIGGEAPEILRNYSSNKRLFRSIVECEYSGKTLVYSSSDLIPRSQPPPSEILNWQAHSSGPLGSQSSAGVWTEESIGGVQFESFFLPELTTSGEVMQHSWFGIRMVSLDLRWHLFIILRIVFFFIAFIAILTLCYLLLLVVRGHRLHPGFRLKLLAALLVISFLPLAMLAYYERTEAETRSEQSAVSWLREESAEITVDLQQRYGINAPIDLSRLHDEQCGDIANEIGTDFSVFGVANVLATSKPELYMAGLIDRRLSAASYEQIVLRKSGFFNEEQTIGNFTYVVGYRPLLSEAGNLIGVVAVPTIYRQPELDSELTERNAYVFSAYAFAMLFSLALGYFFSRRIASPLLQLREATRRVAEGDLSVTVEMSRSDEIGDLATDFNTMTRNLRESQERRLRAERELAWKEMAKQVAHEIKNPLTPIKLSIQHLRQAYKDGAKDFGAMLDQIANTILEQIEALSRIASEFSHFARMPERHLEHIGVHEVLSEAKALFEREHGIEFRLHLGAVKDIVCADKEELRRVFINVLKNAVQAIAEGGIIAIDTKTKDSSIEIAIADTGRGIPAENQSR
ncbi:MAG TPA: HAMP domain-containing protein, partial [Bacteroidota bacterium]|nr:HAMP domain-containing protein [Bacteroidota bacterium]